MPIIKKIKTAGRVLKTRGMKGVVQIIRAKLDRSERPDEAQIVYNLLSATRQSGLMVDVGAHHGASLAPFAEDGWQVLAFEPDSANRAILYENFGALPNVTIDPRACSEKTQPEATLFTSDESSGVSGLSSFLDSHNPGEKVTVTTLSQALAEHNLTLQRIDFLKIDTEGFDLMVLKGYNWADKNPPDVILCEFEDQKTEPLGYTFSDLATFLQDKGYSLVISEWYPVKVYGGLHDWRRFTTYPCTLEDPRSWGNIIAVRDKAIFQQLTQICQLD